MAEGNYVWASSGKQFNAKERQDLWPLPSAALRGAPCGQRPVKAKEQGLSEQGKHVSTQGGRELLARSPTQEWETPLNSGGLSNPLHQRRPHLPPAGN